MGEYAHTSSEVDEERAVCVRQLRQVYRIEGYFIITRLFVRLFVCSLQTKHMKNNHSHLSLIFHMSSNFN